VRGRGDGLATLGGRIGRWGPRGGCGDQGWKFGGVVRREKERVSVSKRGIRVQMCRKNERHLDLERGTKRIWKE